MELSYYYAIYDVSDNAVRSSIIHILKNAGLVRVQKSAFCGTLSGQEKKDLLERIKFVMSDQDDSFYLIQTCNRCFGKISILGKGFDSEYVRGKKAGLVI
jgi:CRISPR-associated protein Cas2